MSHYLLLISLWLTFFAVHSLMASSIVKNKVNRFHPIFKSYYRIIFNLVATFLLVPIAYIYFKLPQKHVWETSSTYEIIGSSLSIWGAYVLVAGFKNYRTDEFIGTYQIRNHHEYHPSKLSQSGWNAIVRHPLYFGGIIIIIGVFLLSPTIKLGLTSLMVLVYLYVGSLWEEKKLISEYGSVYKKYQQEVSMLIPIKWLRRKLS